MNRTTTLISLYTIICFATASLAGKGDPVPPPANPNQNILIFEDGFEDLYEVDAPEGERPEPGIWMPFELELPPEPQPINIRWMPNAPLPVDDAALATRIPRVEFQPLDDHAKVMLACVLLSVAMKARPN